MKKASEFLRNCRSKSYRNSLLASKKHDSAPHSSGRQSLKSHRKSRPNWVLRRLQRRRVSKARLSQPRNSFQKCLSKKKQKFSFLVKFDENCKKNLLLTLFLFTFWRKKERKKYLKSDLISFMFFMIFGCNKESTFILNNSKIWTELTTNRSFYEVCEWIFKHKSRRQPNHLRVVSD